MELRNLLPVKCIEQAESRDYACHSDVRTMSSEKSGIRETSEQHRTVRGV